MTEALIMIGATLGLYVLMRALSRDQYPSASPPLMPDGPDAFQAAQPEPVVLPPASRRYGDSLLEVRGYYFAGCDAATGPADAEDSFDVITLDLYDPGNGNSWKPSFHVATPKGVARKIREEN